MPVLFAEGVLPRLSHYALAQAPMEACGLLSRPAGAAAVDAFDPVPNRAGSSTRFDMDPITVLRTLQRYRETGRELAAVFHSHPEGRAVPSTADLESARRWPGVLQVIRSADGTIGVFDAGGRPQETVG